MQLSTERILTTHTGSLPRPAGLPLDSSQRDAGQLADAVRSVVQAQIDAGVDVVNDGEASKPSYATYVTERLTGFGGEGQPIRPKDYDDFPAWGERMMSERARSRRLTNPACVGPVAYRDTSLAEADITNLQQAAAGQDVADVFMSAASPGVIALFHANQHYGSDEEYIAALADAMKTEYDAIHAAGLVLQLDCPDLAMGWNVAGIGGTPEGFMAAVTARPAAISFEGANPRHEHEWAVFEDVTLPDGKAIIPGVIDSTTNYVEHPELVAQRIERYAQLVGRENVLASSDCGFATFATSATVDPQVTWAKLAAMAEGAALASQALWT
jgi:5-methyltetrahydropteroyltriglutamate--homocysteine methyltransferase